MALQLPHLISLATIHPSHKPKKMLRPSFRHRLWFFHSLNKKLWTNAESTRTRKSNRSIKLIGNPAPIYNTQILLLLWQAEFSVQISQIIFNKETKFLAAASSRLHQHLVTEQVEFQPIQTNCLRTARVKFLFKKYYLMITQGKVLCSN